MIDELGLSVRGNISGTAIDNQRDGWVAFDVDIFGAVFGGAEIESLSIPYIPHRRYLRSTRGTIDGDNGIIALSKQILHILRDHLFCSPCIESKLPINCNIYVYSLAANCKKVKYSFGGRLVLLMSIQRIQKCFRTDG